MADALIDQMLDEPGAQDMEVLPSTETSEAAAASEPSLQTASELPSVPKDAAAEGEPVVEEEEPARQPAEEPTEEPAREQPPSEEVHANRPAKRRLVERDTREVMQELEELRTCERRHHLQLTQQQRRESALVLRLALKEREARDLQTQVRELRQAMRPAHSQVSKLLLDPAVNAEITKLREQVKEAKQKQVNAEQELEASQFQSGSIAGKKLMQKCKELQAENEQLGKDLSEGQVQKLQAEAALHKDYASELRKALLETREWVEQLHEELDVSQAVIWKLRRQVRQNAQEPLTASCGS